MPSTIELISLSSSSIIDSRSLTMRSYDVLDAVDVKPIPQSISEAPSRSRKCAQRSFDHEWQPHKERIWQLYIVEDRPLVSKDPLEGTVARLMEERYGFKAT